MTADRRLRNGLRPGDGPDSDGPGTCGASARGPATSPAGLAESAGGASVRRGAARPHGEQVYAALDLGTNNCRLLIARPSGDSFRVVDSFSRIIRLGEGVSTTGVISEAAIARAMSALGVCREKIVARNARRLRLIATEACRAASNGDAFRKRVSDEIGIDLEVVDRETEATLAVTGCLPLVDPGCDGAILFDIGGGSTELVRLDRPAGDSQADPRMTGWTSLPIGVVTLAEHFGGRAVTRQTYAAMVEEVARHLKLFAASHADDLASMHLLGTSGTVTTIAGVFQKLERYDRRRIDGIWMDDADVSTIIEWLLATSYAERAANPCIGPDRADLVLAGCAILDAIRNAFPVPRLRVADRGLREGMLIEMMRRDGVIAD